AGSCQHHDADRVVAGELVQHLGGARPHLQRDRVAPLRIIEDHVAGAAILAHQHLVGVGPLIHPDISRVRYGRRYPSLTRLYTASTLLWPRAARRSPWR